MNIVKKREKKHENLEKRYPINAKQIMTDRRDCRYCPESSIIKDSSGDSSNTAKCSKCGIGSKNFIGATVTVLAKELQLPVAIVERVDCKYATADIVKANEDEKFNPLEWGVFDGQVYHTLNSAAGDKNTITSSCTEPRQKHEWLDKKCMRFDIENASKAFSAFENDNKPFFRKYTGSINNEHNIEYFDIYYYVYGCPRSRLYEIIVPICSTHARRYKNKNASQSIFDYKQELIGILIIGQLEFKYPPQEVSMPDEDMNEYNDEAKDVIMCLRDKTKLKDAQKFETIEDVLEQHGDNIRRYLHKIRDRLIIRETDYLHLYQSELLHKYMAEEKEDAESIRNKVNKMFRDIFKCFDIDTMFMFFPNLELVEYSPVIEGRHINAATIVGDLSLQRMHFDVNNCPKPVDGKINISDLNKNKFFQWTYQPSGATISIEADEERFYDFYAVKRGQYETAMFFGVFIKWNSKFNLTESRKHCDVFFNLLVSVCFGDITAYVAQTRSSRLNSFAEETSHDIAHQLQLTSGHNISFERNILEVSAMEVQRLQSRAGNSEIIRNLLARATEDLEQRIQMASSHNKDFARSLSDAKHGFHSTMSISNILKLCDQYLAANTDMHDSLLFLKETLDDEALEYGYKPDYFNPHTSIFRKYYQNFNAHWHPLNRGHRLNVSGYTHDIEDTYGDSRMFNRIITNLLDNAFKYSPEGTNIYLQSRFCKESKWRYFDVINFGYGIKNELVEEIFKRKFRGSEEGEWEGSKGLGLTMAREFAGRHDGTLLVTSGIISSENESRVCNIDFTLFNVLNLLCGPGSTKSSKVQRLLERIRKAKKEHELNKLWNEVKKAKEELTETAELQELCTTFEKRDISDLVIVDSVHSAIFKQAEQFSLNDAIDRRAKPLYKITFTLGIPPKK